MATYRFLIGWIEGSDSACDPTGIHTQNDLLDDNNEQVNGFLFQLPKELEEYAWAIGAAKAFQANYTAKDSFSLVQVWDGKVWLSL